MPIAAHPQSRTAILLLLLAASLAARAQTTLLPSGVAYDAAGNLYFADTNRQQVFESTVAGALLVVAGTGTQGYSGDGGQAIAATLNNPQGVAIGADGTLYISDTGNQRIRAVASGQITTFAGTGAAGYAGDNGPATAALFSHPTALAIDATGALLVCDSGNQRIRRIATGQITTIAGSGTQGFSGDGGPATAAQLDTPSGITVAADGRIFIADTHNDRIRVVSTAGVITTFAGNGTAGYAGDNGAATSAELASPRGLFATNSGLLLIADSNNQRIRQVDSSGNITTLAGNGTQGSSADGTTATAASLNTPRAVALSSYSALVFADAGNRLVRELIANGNLYLPAGFAPARTATITLNALVSGSTVGAAQPIASVTVSGSAGTPQGKVQLLNGTTVIAQATLSGGSATFTAASFNTALNGTTTLTAAYLGDGVNPAVTSAPVTILQGQAATVTTEQPSAGTYAGLPLVLTANVAAASQQTQHGTPTGSVAFTEGATTVATATLSAGAASGVYLAPAAGSHQIVASYSGDANFAPSSSAAITATVAAMPDFTVAAVGNTSQTVLAGAIANYTFNVAAQPVPFTGAVSMGIIGLPTGVTAAFSPMQVVPGTGSAQVTLSLQTSATMVQLERPHGRSLVIWALLFPMLLILPRRHRSNALPVCALALLLSATGCGDRTLSAGSQANLVFNLTVSGTGTNLAGAVLTHTVPITLVVQ